eukprot:1261171-Prymnesium_polylepis.1
MPRTCLSAVPAAVTAVRRPRRSTNRQRIQRRDPAGGKPKDAAARSSHARRSGAGPKGSLSTA